MSLSIHRNHYTTNDEPCQLFLMRFRKIFLIDGGSNRFSRYHLRYADNGLTCEEQRICTAIAHNIVHGQRACVLHLADGYARPPTFRGINQWKTMTIFPKAIQEYHKNSQMSSDFSNNFRICQVKSQKTRQKFSQVYNLVYNSVYAPLLFWFTTLLSHTPTPTHNTLRKSDNHFAYYIIKTAYRP